MSQLVKNTLFSSRLADGEPYDQVTVMGFQQPTNFNAVCTALEKSSLPFAPNPKLIFKECSFGGALYVDSVSKLVQSAQAREQIAFKIYLDQSDPAKLSVYDEARLTSLKGVTFYYNVTASLSIQPFTDDTLLGIKRTSLKAKLVTDDSPLAIKSTPLAVTMENPTYFYRRALQEKFTPEVGLRSFFSQSRQQQSDYTCGPATLRMVAEYYDSMPMHSKRFCGEEISHPDKWREINTNPEMELAAQVKTTEADGSDIEGIREGLMAKKLTVVDDNGLSDKEHSPQALVKHKELLWDRMKEILKLGIPVILNMQDRTGCGHFEVVIGIENTTGGERIILAEPGTALTGKLEFENVPKEEFIPRWKNMSGEFHGRFVVLPPNEAATKAIESILGEIPHCMNGERITPSEDREISMSL